MKAKMIKYYPNGNVQPWNKYEYECIDCGSHYYKETYNSRISPYCIECKRKHRTEDSKINAQKRKAKREADIRADERAKVVDEFVQECKGFEDITFDKFHIERIELIAKQIREQKQ